MTQNGATGEGLPIGGNLDFYGGNSTYPTTGSNVFGDGSSAVGTTSGHYDGWNTQYTLLATTPGALRRVGLTFADFNDPREVKFFTASMNVIWQAETEIKLSLTDFFHPLQSFSSYQSQTFVIAPYTSVYMDPGDFEQTLGEVSLLVAKADYYADATEEQNFLYWQYGGDERYVMNEFMVLTGAVKNGSFWKGWSTEQYPTEIGFEDGVTGGFTFSNPTEYKVKLTVLAAN
jgi:hypothetical protein